MSNLFETECNAKPVSAAIDKRGSKLKVRVEFEIVDGEHKGKRVAWDGKLDDNNIKWTKRNLATLGWQGKTSASIESDVLKDPKPVRIKTRIARYTRDDGSVSEWTSVDRIFGSGGKPSDPVTKDDVANIDQWFSSVQDESSDDSDRIPF